MPATPILNALVPFSTALANDGLMHVRAWHTGNGPLILVAELDWPILVARGRAGYSGPGVFHYPHRALPEAMRACGSAITGVPQIIVRTPAPPAERFDRVVDPDDPQGWEPVPAADLDVMLGQSLWPGPPPGRYTVDVVEKWIRDGTLPAG